MTYIEPLIELFEANANEENSTPMAKYMKDHFEYLGLKSPFRKALQQQFLKANGLPNLEQLPEIIDFLWNQPKREYQYFGMDLLVKMRNKVPEDFLPIYEKMVITKSWWDTVDLISSNLIGFHLAKYTQLATITDTWSSHDDMWLRRTALLFQLKYKQELNTIKLEKYIVANLGSKEFFINKAIGWILREYSKTNPKYVIDFVKSQPQLSNLSKKEALKRIDK